MSTAKQVWSAPKLVPIGINHMQGKGTATGALEQQYSDLGGISQINHLIVPDASGHFMGVFGATSGIGLIPATGTNHAGMHIGMSVATPGQTGIS